MVFLYRPVIFSISYRGVGNLTSNGSDQNWDRREYRRTENIRKSVRCFILHGGGSSTDLFTRLDPIALWYPAFHIARGWLVLIPRLSGGFGTSSNPLYHSANQSVRYPFYSFDLTAQTWLTATIKISLQSIKAVFKRGVHLLYFGEGLLDPVLSSTRTGSWVVIELDDIITYLRPALQTVHQHAATAGGRNRSSSTRSVNRFSNSRTPRRIGSVSKFTL